VSYRGHVNIAYGEREATRLLATALRRAGWKVDRQPRREQHGPSLRVRRRGFTYAVAVKAGAEGRPDRLVPLFAQAVLEASRHAGGATPMAVVAAPKVAPRTADQILRFAREFAPGVGAGVMDFRGLRAFRGTHLDGLTSEPSGDGATGAAQRRESGQLFSDLNQWMLKVLLAPEIPGRMLGAPRGRYRNASELARAAGVSVMTAFRLVRQLHREGYLHESRPHLELVRREHLFRRWEASAQHAATEAPMRFALPGDTSAQLARVLADGRACLALFAAADALGLGHVEGVPPYVYVRRARTGDLPAANSLRPCAPGEPPHLTLREAPAPESVFRGVVRPRGVAACDVVQVWLDVASHPSRGREQAELIRRRVLDPVIAGGR